MWDLDPETEKLFDSNGNLLRLESNYVEQENHFFGIKWTRTYKRPFASDFEPVLNFADDLRNYLIEHLSSRTDEKEEELLKYSLEELIQKIPRNKWTFF